MTARQALRQTRRRLARLRTRRREAFFKRARRHTPFLAVEADDAIYFVSTQDSNVGRGLFIKRARKEFIRLERALDAIAAVTGRPAAGTFLDLGANIGTVAIPAVLKHGFERAVALEPSPENYQLLALNIQVNELAERIVPLQVAASDVEGVARFDVASSNAGEHHLLRTAETGEQTVEVETASLDNLADRGVFDPTLVGVLWMDVEGHEAQVLAGASSLMSRGVPLVAEICPRYGVARELELIEEHYSHFLDLRALWTGTPPFRPTTELRSLADQVGNRFTDVLALRLNP